MKVFGLVGYPLGHSFSPAWFAQKFEEEGVANCSYHLFELCSIEELPSLLASTPELCGFNVTIPYKQRIIPYLSALSAEAAAVGAVNCVVRTGNRLIGHNTDVDGFRKVISDKCEVQNALILGTGGASKAVQYVLRQQGIPYKTVSRTVGKGNMTYAQVTHEVIACNHLIINASPVGMFPNVDEAPVLPYEALTTGHRLIDLVYNPAQTRFLQLGAARGAHTQNGLEMLYAQAEGSWEKWRLL